MSGPVGNEPKHKHFISSKDLTGMFVHITGNILLLLATYKIFSFISKLSYFVCTAPTNFHDIFWYCLVNF